MITDNENVMLNFYRYFNSYLSCVDMIYTIRQLHNNQFIEKNSIVLQVNDNNIFNQLIEHNYLDIVLSIIKNVKIEKSCRDIFLSEIDEKTLTYIESLILFYRTECEICVKDGLILVQTNDLFADLILFPIGLFHSEILNTYNQFNNFIKAIGDRKISLFLNTNAPTAFSCFIQSWVGENLGIALVSPNSNTIVI